MVSCQFDSYGLAHGSECMSLKLLGGIRLFKVPCCAVSCSFAHLLLMGSPMSQIMWACETVKLAEWRSGSVSALPCERPGFASRTRLREIIPANNCTMQGQNNWGNWGSPGVMKLWVAWEVLRWLMKFRELCSGGFHPKLVMPPYHRFLNVNTPPNSQNSKRHYKCNALRKVPVGKHNNRQHASPHHEVATHVKQMPIWPIIIIVTASNLMAQ